MFKTRNSVNEMVDVLKRIGPMEENDVHKAAFGFDRNNTHSSNKKYADMLRRGMKKGLIDRMEWPSNAIKYGNAKFIYFATKQIITEPDTMGSFDENGDAMEWVTAWTQEDVNNNLVIECSAQMDMEMANESENLI